VLTGTKGVDKLRGRDKDNISLSKVFIETCHPKQFMMFIIAAIVDFL
jgi:hypothetical protein